MPRDEAANQTKQLHHVANPNRPRYTSVVKTLKKINEFYNAKMKTKFHFVLTDFSPLSDILAVVKISLSSIDSTTGG